MKPFRIYGEEKFPTLSLRNPSISTKDQATFNFNEKEVPQTELCYITTDKKTEIQRHVVRSGVWRNATGYVRLPFGGDRLPISGYIHNVEIDLLRHAGRRIVILQGPKKVCRGVVDNFQRGQIGIQLREKFVDINRVVEICPSYRAMSFRNLSSFMTSLSVYGDQLQHDRLLKQLTAFKDKSTVIINWDYKDEIHPVMVTESGILVLIQDYKKIPDTEIRLILDVYDKVVCEAVCGPKADFDDPLDPTSHQIAKTARKRSSKHAEEHTQMDKHPVEDTNEFKLNDSI